MFARITRLAVSTSVLVACGPPPVLSFSGSGESHLFPSSGKSHALSVDSPDAPSGYRISWRDSPTQSSPSQRTGVLTAEGIAALDAAVTTLEDGWDGPYDGECADCWHTTWFSLRDETGASVGAEFGVTPDEFVELDGVIRAVKRETMMCGPYMLTEPQPATCYGVQL